MRGKSFSHNASAGVFRARRSTEPLSKSDHDLLRFFARADFEGTAGASKFDSRGENRARFAELVWVAKIRSARDHVYPPRSARCSIASAQRPPGPLAAATIRSPTWLSASVSSDKKSLRSRDGVTSLAMLSWLLLQNQAGRNSFCRSIRIFLSTECNACYMLWIVTHGHIRQFVAGRDSLARAANGRIVMRVPILKQGDYIIASIQSALTDDDLFQLRDDLAAYVGRYRSRGVIMDVTVLDLMDSFATRTVRDLAQMVRLRGATTVIVGIPPEVAFAMVQLGLELGNVATALDLEEALALLRYESN
jgi:rsbT antagonist protein RsbS